MLRRFIDAFSAAPPRVRVTDGRIEFVERGRVRRVDLAALDEVGILTTSGGPFQDDVFWVLNAGETRLLVPWNVDGASELLAALQDLPGFDHDAVIAASGSTEEAAFQAWVRP